MDLNGKRAVVLGLGISGMEAAKLLQDQGAAVTVRDNSADNAKVAALLESERIGVSVSEGFQLHPEQTTDAIICHHPKAKYFIA